MKLISTQNVENLISNGVNVKFIPLEKIQPLSRESFSTEEEWEKEMWMCGMTLMSSSEPPLPLLRLNDNGIYIIINGKSVVMAYRACSCVEIPSVVRGEETI